MGDSISVCPFYGDGPGPIVGKPHSHRDRIPFVGAWLARDEGDSVNQENRVIVLRGQASLQLNPG